MKKIIPALSTLACLLLMLAGCATPNDINKTDKISVVTTIFPEYDWTREIIKGNENIELTMLLDKGVDLHSFQPSADDIVKLSSCDVLIYVGGESDGWIEDALAEAKNENMITVNLLNELGENIKEEEIVQGMESEEDSEEDEPEYDEHVWLSLKNAKILCKSIADCLSKTDPANKDLYEKNLQEYTSKLDALDKEYETTVSNASVKTVLFGDRFPFRYMTDDYGLEYFAAFAGCSAESEASFETITFLAQKADELNLSAIIQIDNADGKIAQTIKDTTSNKNQQILTMNSMQSVTAADVKNNVTYLGIMQENLSVLSQAIN